MRIREGFVRWRHVAHAAGIRAKRPRRASWNYATLAVSELYYHAEATGNPAAPCDRAGGGDCPAATPRPRAGPGLSQPSRADRRAVAGGRPDRCRRAAARAWARRGLG